MEAIGAEEGERTGTRVSYRSGYYRRSLVTGRGRWSCGLRRIELASYGPPCLSASALGEGLVPGAVKDVCRVFPPRLRAIIEELCGHEFTASAISQINKTLDVNLKAFCE